MILIWVVLLELVVTRIANFFLFSFLVTVDSDALDMSYCGKEYTPELIDSLPSHVDLCGEDGEFHTLVTSAPCFKGKLKIELEKVEQGERFVHQRYQACII